MGPEGSNVVGRPLCRPDVDVPDVVPVEQRPALCQRPGVEGPHVVEVHAPPDNQPRGDGQDHDPRPHGHPAEGRLADPEGDEGQYRQGDREREAAPPARERPAQPRRDGEAEEAQDKQRHEPDGHERQFEHRSHPALACWPTRSAREVAT